MKKYALIVFITLIISSISYPQSGWEIQRFSGTFYSVNFSDNNTGYLLGNAFELYKTTNSGVNWSIVYTNFYPNPYDVYSIFFTDNNSGYVCGDYARIFRTTDGGNNWTLNNIPGILGIYLYDIKFLNIQTGYLVGYNYILKTINSGNNWQIYQAPVTTDFKNISFVDINTGFVTGGNKCFKTTNAGNNWDYYSYPVGIYLEYIHFPDANVGYGVGPSNIAKTTNGGLNWVKQYADSNYFLNAIHFINLNTGFATGNNGVIIKTTNGGDNWIKQPLNLSEGLRSLFFINNTTGFITGHNYSNNLGIVLKTTNGGNVFVNNISTEVPSAYSLSQNYPNPFNPVTKIKFSIVSSPRVSGGDLVQLKVYDAMGREIQTLVNEVLQPGTYETTFDGSKLNSGVYFYKMITDGFTETRKMLLIK